MKVPRSIAFIHVVYMYEGYMYKPTIIMYSRPIHVIANCVQLMDTLFKSRTVHCKMYMYGICRRS